MDDWARAQRNAQMAAQQAAQQAAAQAQFNAQMAAQQAAAQAAWAARAAAQQAQNAQDRAPEDTARPASADASDAARKHAEEDLKSLDDAQRRSREDDELAQYWKQFYARMGRGIEDKQRKSQEYLDLEDRAQVDAATRVSRSDFGQTPALREVWERASNEQPDTRRGYDAACDEFWKILHNESDQDAGAHAVRQMLELAGYNFGRGEGAPLLDLLPHSNTSVSTKQLQLSIDHADLGSKDGGWLSAHNLRFTLTDDNVERNTHFNAKDVPFKGWEWPRQRPRRRSELN